jgi:osmoprotectant transport system permease protein
MMDYLSKHYDDLLTLLFQHFVLTFVSLLIALAIALPVGFYLSRHRRISVPVLSVLSIIYAIPSLGMFAMLIPIVGLGAKPAIIALVVYSQLILVRNVMAGFQAIDPAVIEAGQAMGYGRRQLFYKIELPLALPLILGGLRIASVSVIGIATIAAWINAGGLGVVLFEGLYQNSVPKMAWGTLLVSLLAIAVNQIVLKLERRAMVRARGEQRT